MWRQLKKELFTDTSPRPRTSKTFEHTDIFNLERQSSNSRVRYSNSYKSQILTQVHTTSVNNERGKRTYRLESKEPPARVRSQNKHKRADHSPDYLFGAVDAPTEKHRRCQTQNFVPHFDDKDTKQTKVDELYDTKVFSSVQNK